MTNPILDGETEIRTLICKHGIPIDVVCENCAEEGK